MPELTYPLERAQAFAEAARARAGGQAPDSLLALEALLVRYRMFLDTLDRVRRDESRDAAGRTSQPRASRGWTRCGSPQTR